MLAHLCWMAWKLPIGLPNCSRTLAYSTLISSTRWAPPHISAHSPTLPRSAMRSSSFQPSPGAPSMRSAGTRTSFSTTSASLRVWSMVLSCVVMMPGPLASTTKSVMPSAPFEPGARAATTIRSAVWASGTNSFVPESTQPLPSLRASSWMPSASQRPDGSRCARVTFRSPVASFGRYAWRRASLPWSSATPPSTTVEKNGPGRTTRPISSSTTTRSTKSSPAPPYCSGRMSPIQPRSAMRFQRSSVKPTSSSIILRTKVMGASLPRKSRAELRSISCSSLKPKSIAGIPSRRLRGPCFPEVVVEAAAFVEAPEGELERHVDGDALGVAVGDLEVEAAAPVEVDDGMRGRGIRALEQVVVGEGEEHPTAGERGVLEAAGVPALDADPVLRELHRAARGAAAAGERQELFTVAERDHGRGLVGSAGPLADEATEARVAAVRRQRALHLDLLGDAGAGGRP